VATGSLLAHPNAPGERPCLLISYGAPRQLESQLYLAVMVAFVPNQVLEQENRVVVMKVHVPACLHPAPDRVPHRPGALIQRLADAARVKLDLPFFLGHDSGEFGRVLEDEHLSAIVDVCEQLRNGWATLYRLGRQPTLRQSVKQIEQNGVVSVPGV
jgi:hypothetical protein